MNVNTDCLNKILEYLDINEITSYLYTSKQTINIIVNIINTIRTDLLEAFTICILHIIQKNKIKINEIDDLELKFIPYNALNILFDITNIKKLKISRCMNIDFDLDKYNCELYYKHHNFSLYANSEDYEILVNNKCVNIYNKSISVNCDYDTLSINHCVFMMDFYNVNKIKSFYRSSRKYRGYICYSRKNEIFKVYINEQRCTGEIEIEVEEYNLNTFELIKQYTKNGHDNEDEEDKENEYDDDEEEDEEDKENGYDDDEEEEDKEVTPINIH
jgi:hypothetical protein